jgi:ankyrin repeat protein
MITRARVFALLVVSLPYLLYAVAQTSRLHDAIMSHDIATIDKALMPWKSINGRNREGMTPLQIAVHNRDLASVRYLLGRGAFADIADFRGDTALKVALQNNDFAICELLLQYGALAGSPGVNDKAINERVDYLKIAVEKKQRNLVVLLLKYGAQANQSKATSRAVQDLDFELVELLLNAGANAEALLLDIPVELNSRSKVRLEIGDLLIKRGANVAAIRDKNTLFSRAMYATPTDLEMMAFLVGNKYPLGLNADGRSPLRYAARAKYKEAVKLLLDHGADANDFGIECLPKRHCSGLHTALHEAADLTSNDTKLETVSVEIVTLLLQRGANPNVSDEMGYTPLFFAIYTSNLKAAEALIEAGADPNIGRAGSKPIEIARKKFGVEPLIELLLAHGAREESAPR